MTTYMIGYDLDKEGSRYSEVNKRLTDKIKSMFTTWWHQLDSTWLVESSKSCVEIRDELAPYIDANSKLLVLTAKAPAAWKGFEGTGSDWLKNNLK